MSTKAGKPYLPGIAPEDADKNNALKAEAIRRAFKAGLIGLGGGAGIAALLGIPRSMQPAKGNPYPLQTEVDLPYPQVHKSASIGMEGIAANPISWGGVKAYTESNKAKDPTEGALRGGVKGMLHGASTIPGALFGGRVGRDIVASGKLGGMKAKLLTFLSSVAGSGLSAAALKHPVDKIGDELVGQDGPRNKTAGMLESVIAGSPLGTKAGDPVPSVTSPSWLRGDSQSSVNAIPWAMPLAAAAAGGGLYGGHQLVRSLLKKHRKADLQRQLDAAQKEYEESMLAQYDPSKLRNLGGVKAAGSGDVLDACFDAMEKKGFMGVDFNDLAGQGAGAYLTGAGLLGTAAGVGTYKWLGTRSKHKVLEKAMKRRAILRAMQQPQELFVRPVPVEYEESNDKES